MTTKVWFVVRLAVVLSILGSAIGGATMPGFAQDSSPPQPSSDPNAGVESLIPEGEPVERSASRRVGIAEPQPTVAIPQSDLDSPSERLSLEETLRERQQPATTVTDWLAQIEASIVEVTGVRVEETETGLQVILETTDGSLQVPETRSVGNALIADIPNAAVAEEFSQLNPIEGIALVSVTSLPGDRVRVAITGTDAPPVAEVTSETQGLVLVVTLGDADTVTEEDAIQVVVTGEQDEGYNPSTAITATRTDTPLRDVPQSIQVIPQQVLRDQQAVRLEDALQNVSGVGQVNPRTYSGSGFTIRGFSIDEFSFFGTFLRDGLQDPLGSQLLELTSVERVEILRGPASVLFGSANPGGTINIITKQPLSDPFYELSATVGNYDFYRGAIDLSGSLNESETVLYRLNASYRSTGSFIDFVENQNIAIAPVLSWRTSDNTKLTFSGEYVNLESILTPGQPASGTVLPNPNGRIPRDFNGGEPDSKFDVDGIRTGIELEHQFSDNWSLQSAFGFRTYREIRRDTVFPSSLSPDNIAFPALMRYK